MCFLCFLSFRETKNRFKKMLNMRVLNVLAQNWRLHTLFIEHVLLRVMWFYSLMDDIIVFFFRNTWKFSPEFPVEVHRSSYLQTFVSFIHVPASLPLRGLQLLQLHNIRRHVQTQIQVRTARFPSSFSIAWNQEFISTCRLTILGEFWEFQLALCNVENICIYQVVCQS